jgi:competence protein ComEC
VTVLDVGQGDAIVVELPDRQTFLVDAGPGGAMRLDAGERLVAPFLWNRGIMRLASAVTTHRDQDHAGGMAAIARLFPIAASGQPLVDPSRARWMAGVRITSVNPFGEAAARSNERAIVLRLEYGLASFLLASDIGATAERAILATGSPLAATVLKVGHHGSARSSTSEFLDAVRPAIAIISVGARNAYGHPAPDTLGRLATVRARILRTDRDGAILVETDGRALSVTRWASRHTERLCLDPEASC